MEMNSSHSLDDFEKGFQQLDDLLGRNHLSLHIICCGGYLIQRMGFRGTIDVDAFYQSNDEIDLLIRRVGALLDLNTDHTTWLNKSVSTMSNWPDDKFCERLYTFDHLTVDRVTTEYLLGMKLRSTRARDVTDSVHLIEHLGILDPIELYNHLDNMSIDVGMSYILTAFSEMHGEDWFKEYYPGKEQELLKLFRLDDIKGKRSM